MRCGILITALLIESKTIVYGVRSNENELE